MVFQYIYDMYFLLNFFLSSLCVCVCILCFFSIHVTCQMSLSLLEERETERERVILYLNIWNRIYTHKLFFKFYFSNVQPIRQPIFTIITTTTTTTKNQAQYTHTHTHTVNIDRIQNKSHYRCIKTYTHAQNAVFIGSKTVMKFEKT